MKSLFISNAAIFVVILLVAGCGENINNPPPQTGFNPPNNLRAVSLNGSSIRIEWTASTSASDSSFAGYLISWGTRVDSLVATVLFYTIDSLSQGEALVSIRSRRTDRMLSDPAVIRWAPADRFDAGYVLREYYLQEQGRLAGLDIGGQQNDPLAMALDVTNPQVAQRLDVYLFGGEGEIEQPLALRSANMFLGSWNSSAFSTVSHASTSLDYRLGGFPSAASFTENAVTLQDNRIYYVRISGDQGSVNYARVHARILPSGGPRNRSVELRISLQRVPGLPYAEIRPSERAYGGASS